MASPEIEVRGISKSFDSVDAVTGVSFEVQAGEVVGLLGPNGAGKTTTINMLSTLVEIDAGAATIGGFDVSTQGEAVRQLIGLAGQSAAVDEKLTTRENLELFGRLYKLPRDDRRRRIDALIERFDLGEFADRPASTYSGGQRRRLDVAAALVANPSVVFLDEPTTGLDPRSRNELWSAVRSLAASGTAIVLTTQYLEEADQLADRILLIDRGQIVAEGTPDSLKRDFRGDVLVIDVATTDDLDRARALLDEEATVSPNDEPPRIEVPVRDGSLQSLDLLRRLEDQGVGITGYQLRQPSLDEVFLSLTGSTPTADREGGSPA